jgi:pimeloyl-ACP methyl ester carboxylesterase
MASVGSPVRQMCALATAVLIAGMVGVSNPAAAAPSPEARGPASTAVPAPLAPWAGPTGTGSRTGSRAGSPVDPDWQPCGPDHPGYDCATVEVPLDYDRPSQGATHLALARWPAMDAQQRIGSVFINPGGPGGSGTEYVLGGFGESLGAQLEGRFDVVGFDPRGVGASDPLHCFDTEEQHAAFWSSQPVFPYSRDQYRPFFEAYSGLGDECLDGDERIARHMNTADVARDLDLLREAVGDSELTYLGFSYGSYLGTTYANLYPDRVRAVVIDGVLDPRLWSSGRQIASDRTSTQEVMDEFLRLCDEAAERCAFWTPEGSESRWDRLSEAVRREPVLLWDGQFYTYDVLISDVASAMYVPEIWGGDDGAAVLLDLLADVTLADDRGAAAEALRTRAALIDRLTAGVGDSDDPREADYPNDLDAFYGNHCADTRYPESFRTWREVGRYAHDGSPFGPLTWWQSSGCADWPVNRDRYTGPWTARTASPVLVVGNYFDNATDYDGAVAVNGLLRDSELLSYAGWGHTAYGRSQCVDDHVQAYLTTVSLPPRGTVCPASPNPFLASDETRAARSFPTAGLPSPWILRPDLPTSPR